MANRIRLKSIARALGAGGCVCVLLAACSTLEVTSEPPAAKVMWSPTGTGDWREWPPRAWSGPDTPSEPTPLTSSGRYGDTVWITVEKDGYYRPLPQMAQLYLFSDEKLHFDLVETPEAFAARMREQGLVRYKDEWVDPQELDLVEFQGVWMTREMAGAAEKRAQGLVQYKGNWVTPEEREKLFAEAQAAKGLVQYKGRWVKPEVREQEQEIDARVAELAESDPFDLDPPRPVGRLDAADAQLQIVNSTSQKISVLFSGPMSREVVLDRYDSDSRVILPPGRYKIAIQPQAGIDIEQEILPGMIERERELRASFTESPLASGYKYMISYSAGRSLAPGELEQYEIPQPELPDELPTIEVPDVQIPERKQPPRPGAPGGGRQGRP